MKISPMAYFSHRDLCRERHKSLLSDMKKCIRIFFMRFLERKRSRNGGLIWVMTISLTSRL